MKLNCKKTIIGLSLTIALSGCATQDVVSPELFDAPKGSLRYTTIQFAKEYGISSIVYHHQIPAASDHQLLSPKVIEVTDMDLQSALWDLYDRTPYLPILNDKSLVIYPITSKFVPLAGSISNDIVTDVDEILAQEHLEESKRLMEESNARQKRSAGYVSSQTSHSNLMASQSTPDSDLNLDEFFLTDEEPTVVEPLRTIQNSKFAKADSNLTAVEEKKISAIDEKKVTQDSISESTDADKPQKYITYELSRGQSLRGALNSWLGDFGINQVVFEVGAQLDTELKANQKSDLKFLASNAEELMQQIYKSLTDKNTVNAFKFRIIESQNTKKAVLHQYPFNEVRIFDVQQGSLKENAFALAKSFGYSYLEEDSEFNDYKSWNLNVDPRVQATTPIVISNDVRFAFARLFKNYQVQALLQDSTKTVFFTPRTKQAIK